MFDRNRTADRVSLARDRGATDPILIIAGIAITLILLVGGSFAISGFIANANNLNAKADLDRIATAQAAYMVENDGYGTLNILPGVGADTGSFLGGASLGFTPTAGNPLVVGLLNDGAGWFATTKSASGEIFIRTSRSTEIVSAGTEGVDLPPLPGVDADDAFDLEVAMILVRNY